jgi:uncharacterized protein (TIGR03435 family)
VQIRDEIFRLSIAAVMIAAVHVHGRVLSQSPAAGSTARLEFEAASIKRNTSGPGFGGMGETPGGFLANNAPIRSVLTAAYPTRNLEIVGLPDWVSEERYDIQVTWRQGVTRDQIRQMWRTFFEERMNLAAHYETRELPAFALTIDRKDRSLGPNLRSRTTPCPGRGAPPPADPEARPCGIAIGPGTMSTGGAPLAQLLLPLQALLGRTVLDQTGLTGLYEFTLTYTSQLNAAADGAADDAPPVSTALQEQLGLKLVPTRAPVEVLVVDRIERPTAN